MSCVGRADLICNCLASDLIPLFLSAANLRDEGRRDGWYSLVTELAPNGLDTPSLTGAIATSAALAIISTDSQENDVIVFLKKKKLRKEKRESAYMYMSCTITLHVHIITCTCTKSLSLLT